MKTIAARRRRTFAWAGAVSLSLLVGIPASGFVLDIQSPDPALRWHLDPVDPSVPTTVVNPVSKSIRFHLGAAGYSTTNTTAELNALRASFDQWEAVTGTRLKFEEGELMGAGVDLNPNDGTNVIYFAKSTVVEGGASSIAGTLGVTCITSSGGVIEEADIVLNGADWNWFTDHTATPDAPDAFFVEGTATHEIGHFLGLLHSPVGGATMLFRGKGGIEDHQAGLSSDEIAAVRHLYPDAATAALWGSISGRVTKDAAGVFGAIVVVEDEAGNVAQGTVTDADGDYLLSALEPGDYTVRVTPLAPAGLVESLIFGEGIGSEFAGADFDFRASGNLPVTVAEGQSVRLDAAVEGPRVGYLMSRTRIPEDGGDAYATPATLMLGASGVTFGVLVPGQGAVVNGAELRILGDGLSFGATTIDNDTFDISPSVKFTLVETTVTVAGDATPGLRSIRLSQGAGEVVWANGFVEILPAFADYNFDGLEDHFQRSNFALWTAEEAGPLADPDNDNFPNASEAAAATDPNDAGSRIEVESVTQDLSGTTVMFQSVAGKQYQVSGRDQFGVGDWADVGSPVTAVGASTQVQDAGATGAMKFYRVELVP